MAVTGRGRLVKRMPVHSQDLEGGRERRAEGSRAHRSGGDLARVDGRRGVLC